MLLTPVLVALYCALSQSDAVAVPPGASPGLAVVVPPGVVPAVPPGVVPVAPPGMAPLGLTRHTFFLPSWVQMKSTDFFFCFTVTN